MLNNYDPKPIQAFEFDGANEAAIQAWLEGFGYTVDIFVNGASLEIFIREINQRTTAATGEFVVYWVAQILLEHMTATEIAARLDIIP